MTVAQIPITGTILSFPHPPELDGNKVFQFMILHFTVTDI
jgi:hypothetical protein